MPKTFEEIYAPATEPVTIANNANQTLYKNHRQWREYAQALKEQNDELKAIVSEPQLIKGNWHSDEEFQELKHQHEIELYEQRQYIKSQLKELKNESLPVVSQFVAEAVESNKNDGNYLTDLFMNAKQSYESGEDFGKWLFGSGSLSGQEKQRILARAWLDGYTVEQEKLYIVQFLGGRYTLTRRSATQTLPFNYEILWEYSTELKDRRKINKNIDKFTESEIKAIDEHYMAFAMPVESVQVDLVALGRCKND